MSLESSLSSIADSLAVIASCMQSQTVVTPIPEPKAEVEAEPAPEPAVEPVPEKKTRTRRRKAEKVDPEPEKVDPEPEKAEPEMTPSEFKKSIIETVVAYDFTDRDDLLGRLRNYIQGAGYKAGIAEIPPEDYASFTTGVVNHFNEMKALNDKPSDDNADIDL